MERWLLLKFVSTSKFCDLDQAFEQWPLCLRPLWFPLQVMSPPKDRPGLVTVCKGLSALWPQTQATFLSFKTKLIKQVYRDAPCLVMSHSNLRQCRSLRIQALYLPSYRSAQDYYRRDEEVSVFCISCSLRKATVFFSKS